jgi:hypothetical protein
MSQSRIKQALEQQGQLNKLARIGVLSQSRIKQALEQQKL